MIVSLRQWGERNAFADGEAHSTLIDDATGQAVRVLDRDGVMLDSAATHVERVPSGE